MNIKSEAFHDACIQAAGGVATGELVILLHGVGRSAASMRRLERAISKFFPTLNLGYDSRRKRLEALVEDVRSDTAPHFASGVTVHLVCHSMGGLIARGLINRHRPENLGRVVMLGTPNQGSELADLLAGNPLYDWLFGPAGRQLAVREIEKLHGLLGDVDFPLGVIAGNRSDRPLGWLILPKPNDGRVAVARTKIAGMADHVTLRTSHNAMMRSAAVQRQVLNFLRDGRFYPEA